MSVSDLPCRRPRLLRAVLDSILPTCLADPQLSVVTNLPCGTSPQCALYSLSCNGSSPSRIPPAPRAASPLVTMGDVVRLTGAARDAPDEVSSRLESRAPARTSLRPS